MANAALKKVRYKNKQVFLIWIIASIVTTIIAALFSFVFKVGRAPPPPKPRIRGQKVEVFRPRTEAPFWSGLSAAVIGLALVYNRIRYRPRVSEVERVPELSGRKKNFWLAFYLDVVGIGLIVEFTGIWWRRACLLFWLVPMFIVYTVIRRMLGWFDALTGR
jgi:hypothetical protein